MVTLVSCMPIYEPWLRAKNGHQKDMGLKEIKVLAQNLLTVLGLTMDMIGGRRMYDHLIRMRVVTLIMNKIII